MGYTLGLFHLNVHGGGGGGGGGTLTYQKIMGGGGQDENIGGLHSNGIALIIFKRLANMIASMVNRSLEQATTDEC